MPEIFDTEPKIEGIIADTDTTSGGVGQDVLNTAIEINETPFDPLALDISLGSGQEIQPINDLINPQSKAFLEEPAFPDWISGHSTLI